MIRHNSVKRLLCLLLMAFPLLHMPAFTTFAQDSEVALPMNFTLRGFHERCAHTERPCWFGIVPGETSRDEMIHVLQGLGYTVPPIVSNHGDWFYHDHALPSTINAHFACRNSKCIEKVLTGFTLYGGEVRLHQAIALFGQPAAVTYHILEGRNIVFDGHSVEVEDWQSPTVVISAIHIHHFRLMSAYSKGATPWHGYMRMEEYCRREPDYEYCELEGS